MIFSCFFTIFIVFLRFSTILNAGNTPAVPRQCHGVSGSSRAVFGGPEAKNSPILNYGSVRHLCGLLSISTPQGNKFPYIYYGSGRADLTTGEASFWGPGAQKRPFRRRDSGAKTTPGGGQIPYLNDGSNNSSGLARFGGIWRRRELPPRPYLHARIPRMT